MNSNEKNKFDKIEKIFDEDFLSILWKIISNKVGHAIGKFITRKTIEALCIKCLDLNQLQQIEDNLRDTVNIKQRMPYWTKLTNEQKDAAVKDFTKDINSYQLGMKYITSLIPSLILKYSIRISYSLFKWVKYYYLPNIWSSISEIRRAIRKSNYSIGDEEFFNISKGINITNARLTMKSKSEP